MPLPSVHVGKGKKPAAHSIHLLPTTLALQLHTPSSLHDTLIDPCESQLQAEIWKKIRKSYPKFYESLVNAIYGGRYVDNVYLHK